MSTPPHDVHSDISSDESISYSDMEDKLVKQQHDNRRLRVQLLQTRDNLRRLANAIDNAVDYVAGASGVK